MKFTFYIHEFQLTTSQNNYSSFFIIVLLNNYGGNYWHSYYYVAQRAFIFNGTFVSYFIFLWFKVHTQSGFVGTIFIYHLLNIKKKILFALALSNQKGFIITFSTISRRNHNKYFHVEIRFFFLLNSSGFSFSKRKIHKKGKTKENQYFLFIYFCFLEVFFLSISLHSLTTIPIECLHVRLTVKNFPFLSQVFIPFSLFFAMRSKKPIFQPYNLNPMSKSF